MNFMVGSVYFLQCFYYGHGGHVVVVVVACCFCLLLIFDVLIWRRYDSRIE